MADISLKNFDSLLPNELVQTGKTYFKNEKIGDLMDLGDGEWYATATEESGTEHEITVKIDGSSDVVFNACDCDLFDGHTPCKHILGTLFAIREKQIPNSAFGSSRLSRAAVLADVRERRKQERQVELLKKIEAFREARMAAADKSEPKAEPKPEPKMEEKPAPRRNEQSKNLPPDLQIYHSLADLEQKILKAMALIWEGCTPRQLTDVYNHAGFRINGINMTDREGERVLAALTRTTGLVQKSGYNFQVKDTFAQELCDHYFHLDSDFKKLALAVRAKMPAGYFYYGDLAARAFREMRLARYLNQIDVFKTNYYAAVQNSGGKWSQDKICRFWLPEPFDLEQLEAIPTAIRWFLMNEKVQIMTFELVPPDAWFDYTVKQLPNIAEEPLREDLARLLSQIHLLRGEQNALKHALSLMRDPINLGVFTGIQYLLAGNAAASTDAFQLATKELRKTTRNPKAFLTNLAGVFHVLALLKTRDSEAQAKAEDLIARHRKSPSSYLTLFEALGAFLLFLKNEKKTALATLATWEPSVYLFRPFFQLIKFWVEPSDVERTELKKLAQNLLANGYHWLAAEMSQILADTDTSDDDAQKQLAHAKSLVGPFEPLAHLIPRVEDWENALTALLSITPGSAKASARENDTRIVWLVNFEKNTLQPKEQTFGKSGWSGGRNVALLRLKKGNLKSLTEHDQRLARHVVESWGNYTYINFEKALPDLVGHPLLFLEKSPEVAVQLIEDKPVLVARQTADGFELIFSHDIDSEGFKVVKESPTRYKLLHVTAELARIARAFNGRSLQVPARGGEQLKQVVEKLSGIVTVQSAFEARDENLPSVAPDLRTCVHLLPVGDGFHVELFAKPFGETPPYFKPGEGEAQVIATVGGLRTRTTRDLKAEQRNASGLRKKTPVLAENSPRSGVWELENADSCLQLLTQIHPAVERGEIILEWPKGEKFRVTKIAGFDQFRLQVRERQDWFEVSGELRVDENKVLTMQELLDLSERQGQFVEVSPGKFLALTEEFCRRLRQIDGLLARQKNGTLQLHALAAPAFEPFAEALQDFEFDEKFRRNRERLREAFSQKYLLPKKFNATLRPYQYEGFEWLHRCAAWGVGACLADDMGLGKTVQALAFLTDQAHIGPALVVAPASVCRNWLSETEKFAPILRPILFGEGDRAAAVDAAAAGDLVIVTYDLMAREAEHFVKKEWGTIILDEAQAIKNRSTRRSETAMQLQGNFKMLMTGTPLENHLGELWNLFQFANPGLLGSLDQFNERFALPIEKYKDENRREQLKRLVQPFILRRRKSEVLQDLPEKTEITLTVELSPEERHFYEALRRNAVEKLSNDESAPGEKHLRILAEIMRLRRAACHPKLVDPNAGFKESSKLRLFGEIVDELLENGHKALVFSQFVSHLGILEDYLKKKKIAYQYLDGQTPLPKRQKAIEAFQRGEGDLFLISLKAGGVGLNLTAADYVLHMDPWWNPAVEDQATDRAHRIGQEKPVTVYRLVSEATIEEKILKLHEHKRDLADSLLSGADVSARLNADELLALLAER